MLVGERSEKFVRKMKTHPLDAAIFVLWPKVLYMIKKQMGANALWSSISVSIFTSANFKHQMKLYRLNLLNPTGHVMHQQFNIQQL